MKINLIMYILKILTDLCAIEERIRIKNKFANVAYNVLVVKKFGKNKKKCSIINGKQSVKLKSGSISFKRYFKQLPALFKIYADFECILKEVKSNDKNNSSYTKNIRTTFLAVLLIKLFVLIINLTKELFFTEEKMLLTNLLIQFLKSMIIVIK